MIDALWQTDVVDPETSWPMARMGLQAYETCISDRLANPTRPDCRKLLSFPARNMLAEVQESRVALLEATAGSSAITIAAIAGGAFGAWRIAGSWRTLSIFR
jgi:hypothetical protein